ncbi:MAG TPA: hydrophobe/amphiphile efflux-3 (HAE3) family transporter [Methanolinea sp.]|nr:hydrophobe/amphiphile efflux-3 (HAE3) family transporter [Methanolinea sp.]HRU80487.1 hydrophobe/amphiphile efflux-3 (HAE3) family transporter [Methanolinea sp.]
MKTEDVFGGIAVFVNRHPKEIFVVMLVLAAISLFFAGHIPTQALSDEYMDKQSPAGIIYDLYNNRYGQDTYILLIKTPDPGDPVLLNQLLVLEKQLSRISHVDSVHSVADIVAQYHGGAIPGTSAEVWAIIDRLPPDIQKKFVPDRQTALGYVLIEQGVSTDASQNIEPFVVNTVGQATLPPGVSIEITGNTPYTLQFEGAMMADFGVLIIACIIFMLIVMYILYSKIRFWILPIVLLIFGLFYTFGIMGAFGIPANDGAIAAFPILLGLGIDYAVQFHMRFDDERRQKEISPALAETLKHTGPSVLIALASTSLGFAAMFITPIPMIQTFATVSIIGISCCYLTSVLGFGAIVHLVSYEPKPPGRGFTYRLNAAYERVLSTVVSVVVKIAGPVVLVAVVIAAAGIALDSGIPVDASQKSMVPPDLPAQLVADKVQSVSGSLTPLPLYVRGIDPSSVDGIWWIDRLGTELADKYPKITRIESIASLVRSYNSGVLPVSQAGLDRVLAAIPAQERSLYQIDATTSIIIISIGSMTINEQRAFSDNVAAEIKWLEPPPGAEVVPTGDFSLYVILTEQVVKNKDRMTMLGFILIFVLLLLIYRKAVALTPLVPIICVIGWNTLGMIALGQDYSILTAVLGSMTIGVGSEYTILVMERYLEEQRKTGDKIRAIQEAVRKIGSAVVVSGLVTAAGFSALMLSSFPILSGFGLSTVILVIFSLLSASVIMPAVLALVGRQERT